MTTQFELLQYQDLDTSGLERKFKKICDHLQRGDFKTAEVKKLTNHGYYRAKLDDTNRLLFKPISYENKTHLLLLDVIKNHNYDKCRFLRGAEIQEIHINHHDEVTPLEQDTIRFLGSVEKKVHCLDRFIVFDEIQNNIFHYGLPLILIGSAGSGKTSLTLEKLKTMTGNLLYVTLSPYLTHNARQLYYANHYQNDDQDIEFLSFEELIETIAIPDGQEITITAFLHWHQRQKKSSVLNDGRKLYEEFRGVLAGSEPNALYLSKENYLTLGIRQSIYSDTEREEVYCLFQGYIAFLNEEHYFDTNILSHDYQSKASPRYDAVVIDEVQDFTNSQLSLVLSLLKSPHQFFMCGDANQIVHPNFFSWSGLKQLFYTSDVLATVDITRILTRNYRNTIEVTELANRVLKVKNARFGSIDKESHYLIESQSTHTGDVACIKSTPEKIREVNAKISRSINFAVIVFNDQQKAEAQKLFDTPLVFSVQEAKGLEYENVILYHFIDTEKKFLDIADGLDHAALNQEFKYARAKNKSDKSMEVYKFYINSLYVAITRAIKSVYLIERNPSHPLIALLDINEINQSMTMDVKASSIEEWQKEASRLAQQGKTEQAASIAERILKQTTPPWPVIDNLSYEQLKNKIVVAKAGSKKEQMDLLEAAMVYADHETLVTLKQQGFKAAQQVKKSYPIMFEKHFLKYTRKNAQQVHKDIQLYGIEHRTTMNFTPIMAAVYAGNLELINEILVLGPRLDAKDSLSRNALQLALYQAIHRGKEYIKTLANIYSKLGMDSISVDVDNHLVKIDASRAEYLLFNVVSVLYVEMVRECYDNTLYNGFSAAQLADLVLKLPHSIWPEFRKKQSYLSGLLSRNEVDSNYTPNRKLFKRVRRGYYMINPKLKIKTATGWDLITHPVFNFEFETGIVRLPDVVGDWTVGEDVYDTAK